MTLPTFSSYEAQVINTGLQMLINSATFRTLVGAANPTAAQDYVILGDGGQTDDGQAQAGTGAAIPVGSAHACLGAVRFPVEGPYPTDTYERRTGDLLILIYVPPLPGSTPAERYVRALNLLGAIRTELRAQQGSAVGFAHVGVSAQLYPVHDDPAVPYRGEYVGELTLSWRNY